MLKRNRTIDLSKYIASVLIIAIHSKLFAEINSTLNFVTVDIVCRLAVPFFAMCTGYFMAGRLENINEDDKDFVWRHWKKIFIIYIIWTFVYLIRLVPEWIEIKWFSVHAFVDYGIAAIISRPYYHMWYLLSVLYAIPMLALCLKYVKKKHLKWIVIAFWAVKVLSYGYYQWMPSSIINIFSLLEKFSGIRDGIFCIFPLMLLGSYVYYENVHKYKFYIIGFVISFILLIIEAFTLRYFGQNAVSFIIFTLPTSYFLFNLVLRINISIKPQTCVILGMASLFIYLVHPLIVELTNMLVNNSFLCFALTAIIATILGVLYTIIKMHLKTRHKETV